MRKSTLEEVTNARATLNFSTVGHVAMMDGMLMMFRDIVDLIHAHVAETDADMVSAGEVDDWVRKLDTLGNLMAASV